MKRFTIMTVLVLITLGAFSQVDTTGTSQVVNDLLPLAETKWPIVAKVVAGIAVLSELLSVIPSKYIPANGILDAIIKIVKYIGGSK